MQIRYPEISMNIYRSKQISHLSKEQVISCTFSSTLLIHLLDYVDDKYGLFSKDRGRLRVFNTKLPEIYE